jgi:hypothetical protein
MSLKSSGWVFGRFFVHFLAMYLRCTGSGHHPLPPVSSGGVVKETNHNWIIVVSLFLCVFMRGK